MLRSLTSVLAAATVALAATGGVASAQPTEVCDYTLSPPQLVQLSGTTAVTATIGPTRCNSANVINSVACLQLQGSSTPMRCEQNNGPLVAQVYYLPYQPGATYVATGRGCATTGNPPQASCSSVGPISATL